MRGEGPHAGLLSPGRVLIRLLSDSRPCGSRGSAGAIDQRFGRGGIAPAEEADVLGLEERDRDEERLQLAADARGQHARRAMRRHGLGHDAIVTLSAAAILRILLDRGRQLITTPG